MSESRSETKVMASVLDLVGGTPMIRLNRLPKSGSATAVAKVEVLFIA